MNKTKLIEAAYDMGCKLALSPNEVVDIIEKYSFTKYEVQVWYSIIDVLWSEQER